LSSPDPAARLVDAVVTVVGALALPAPIVLIDGPSGAGKSTLADGLVDAWPGVRPELVRMDEMYPGWTGLAAASAQVAEALLHPLRSTGTGRWRRYDWERGEPAEWHPVVADVPLIIEGCGSLSRASAPLVDFRVWLTADDEVRKERALARDNGSFDAYWDIWQAQFDAFLVREEPVGLADLVLESSGGRARTRRSTEAGTTVVS
jgi:hypothetical protein